MAFRGSKGSTEDLGQGWMQAGVSAFKHHWWDRAQLATVLLLSLSFLLWPWLMLSHEPTNLPRLPALHLTLKAKVDAKPEPVIATTPIPEQTHTQRPPETKPKEEAPSPTPPAPEALRSQPLLAVPDSLVREQHHPDHRVAPETRVFDPRLQAKRETALQRRTLARPEPAGYEEFVDQSGRHNIRKGGLCAQDHRDMAALMDIDSLYFVRGCTDNDNALLNDFKRRLK